MVSEVSEVSEVMERWPILKVESWPINRLIEYARNPRQNDAVVGQMVAAIKEFGFRIPIVAKSDGLVIDGHLRLKAARQLGMEEVPVALADELTDTQIKAFRLLANQSANWAQWDMDLLKLELVDLNVAGFDLDLLGFGDGLTDLLDPSLNAPDGKDPDALPDVPEVAYSKPGDVFTLGPHRIMCGDATKIEDWNILMNGELADIQACDPPYNVDIGGKNEMLDRADEGNRGKTGSIMGDKIGDAQFRQFLLEFYKCSFAVMKPGAPIYVSHPDLDPINFRSAFIEAGFKYSGCLTWKKNNFVIGRMDYQPNAEPILYGFKPGSRHRWYGGRKNVTVQEVGEYPPFEKMEDGRYAIRYEDRILYIDPTATFEERETSILYCPKPHRSPMAPTTKPVALWERLMRNSARRGDIVIDGFGGSGTTLMASERLGMSARLMELDSRFVDVIIARYTAYCGRKAIHAVTGEEFPKEVIDRLTASWEKK